MSCQHSNIALRNPYDDHGVCNQCHNQVYKIGENWDTCSDDKWLADIIIIGGLDLSHDGYDFILINKYNSSILYKGKTIKELRLNWHANYGTKGGLGGLS